MRDLNLALNNLGLVLGGIRSGIHFSDRDIIVDPRH